MNLKRDWALWLSTAVVASSLAAILAISAVAQPVSSPDRFGALPVNITAIGTTAATPAVIPAVQNKIAYVCGFSIRANATAAATGSATLAGVTTGTMSFLQWTAPAASGLGILEPPLGECIAASGPNIPITLTSAAPGTAGNVTVNLWGFYL